MSVEVAPEDRDDSDSLDHLIGQTLANRYRIVRRIGEGAMGTVFEAKHVKVGRPFAVKVLRPRLLEDTKLAQRFEREAELAGRLRHPNVIGVVDVGETADGLRYMVMDFAKGNDLATIMVEAPMKPDRIVQLVRQMLEGLYHAHEQGLIHRDFKPENVIVERDDHGNEVPRIVDFGIAILREGGDSANAAGRLTTNGLVLGTPHYMAPEQAVADPIDHRIDLFALGIVVYELLCGRLPFDGSGVEVARANLLLDPPPIAQRVPYLEVDPLLEAFARKLMSKKRTARPATAKQARELLDLIVRDRAAAAAALGIPVPARTPAVTADVAPRPAAKPEPAPQIEELDEDLSDEHAVASASGDVPNGAARALRASALEAPAASAGVKKPTPPRTPSPLYSTTDGADPIALDRPRGRRTWLVAGAGAFSAAALATIVVLSTTNDGDPPARAGSAIARADEPTPAPTPPPPTTPPATTTTTTTTTPATPPTPPAGSAVIAEPVPPPVTAPTSKDSTTSTTSVAAAAPRPARKDRATKEPGRAKVATAKPPTGKQPDDKPRDVTAPDAKPLDKPAEPPAASEVSAADVQSLYASVGVEIARARKAGSSEAIERAYEQYRLIKILAANTPDKRAATAALLKRLRAAVRTK